MRSERRAPRRPNAKALLFFGLCPALAQAEDPTRYVQLPPGSTITSQPRSDALQVALAPAGLNESHETLKLIELGEEWVQLETSRDHLAADFSSSVLRHYALSVYVQRSELATVLAKAYIHTGADGLETVLLPGVPLLEDEAGSLRVAIGPVEGLDPIPLAQTAQTFENSPLEDWITTEEVIICDRDLGVLPQGQGCMVEWSPGDWFQDTTRAYRLRTDAQGSIALFYKTGWLYEERRVKSLSDHANDVPLIPGVLMGAVIGHQVELSQVRVPEGTSVFWLDGTPAGTVRREHELYELQLEARHENLRCTGLPWSPPPEYIVYPEDSLGQSSLGGGLGGGLSDSTDAMESDPPAPALEDHPFQICFQGSELIPVEE